MKETNKSAVTKRSLNRKTIEDYADIINYEYRGSETRRKMSLSDRAAQFAPFAALTGHDAAILETARLTESRIELDETQMRELNERLSILSAFAFQHPTVNVRYFKPDSKKSGGAYLAITGTLREINESERILVLDIGKIPIDDVISLDGDIFNT